MKCTNKETARVIYMMMRKGIEVDKDTKRNLRNYLGKKATQLNTLQALKADLEVTICTDLEDGDAVTAYCVEVEPTDEELHDLYERGQIHSPYDCTGQIFIQGVHKFYSNFLKSWVVTYRTALDV